MSPTAQHTVAAVRRFNRFYTRQVGALGRLHLNGPYALTEVRVLYELAHQDGLTAKDLGAELGLDPGYLSRMLKRFEADGLVVRRPLPGDGRSALLEMTGKGREVFAALDARTRREVEGLVERLGEARSGRLVQAMDTIEALMEAQPRPRSGEVILRPHRVGDMGWIIWRHAALYAEEYGWDERFEALVARICADFLDDHDPACERCWIAEREGERLGCIALVKSGEEGVAKLRILLVEPAARGLGLGRRLVEECIAFARATGYREVVLFTQSNLTAARAIYAKAGFQLESADAGQTFAPGLAGETWRLRLD
jgi:DNA-binding MarR family transcriptional regulator/N-acetylglutamate synthase-like GNAT family acetyltransferase